MNVFFCTLPSFHTQTFTNTWRAALDRCCPLRWLRRTDPTAHNGYVITRRRASVAAAAYLYIRVDNNTARDSITTIRTLSSP